MPQIQLPIFPAGTTKITPELAFEKREGKVVYFNGHLPVFMHAVEDLGAFRLYTSQLIVNGTASQRQIVEAFGVPRVTVKRCVKRLREQGAGVFFKAAERQGGSKLTPERLVQAQGLLDQGRKVSRSLARNWECSRARCTRPLMMAGSNRALKKRSEFELCGADQEPAQRGGCPSAAGGGHDAEFGAGHGGDGEVGWGAHRV